MENKKHNKVEQFLCSILGNTVLFCCVIDGGRFR